MVFSNSVVAQLIKQYGVVPNGYQRLSVSWLIIPVIHHPEQAFGRCVLRVWPMPSQTAGSRVVAVGSGRSCTVGANLMAQSWRLVVSTLALRAAG